MNLSSRTQTNFFNLILETTMEEIDMDKTFIVSSYEVEVSNDDTEEGVVDV